MKRAVVIGGNGKVGGYLCPMLVAEGYQVTAVSRSENPPPVWMPGYEAVERVRLCRGEPGFEAAVAALRPDVVVDMICFTQEEMQAMVDALRGKVAHYLCCGSAWIHGPVRCVPAREEEDRVPLCEYGRQKSAMEETLAALWREEGFPGTMVHPGHIVCPNTWPINPQAHKEPWVFDVLREGRPLALPDLGMGTLHHVHAADVAGVFLAAIRAGEPSFGQGFHAVSPRAITLRGYAEAVSAWFGREPQLEYQPLGEWMAGLSPASAAQARDHLAHSPSYSMEKAREHLGFVPRYTSLQAIRECLASLGALKQA